MSWFTLPAALQKSNARADIEVKTAAAPLAERIAGLSGIVADLAAALEDYDFDYSAWTATPEQYADEIAQMRGILEEMQAAHTLVVQLHADAAAQLEAAEKISADAGDISDLEWEMSRLQEAIASIEKSPAARGEE